MLRPSMGRAEHIPSGHFLGPGPGLAPADGPGTSTSLSWVARNLRPAQYEFSFFAAPRNTNGDHRYSVLVKKAAIVIETWGAGN
jgi:hypothetical protein